MTQQASRAPSVAEIVKNLENFLQEADEYNEQKQRLQARMDTHFEVSAPNAQAGMIPNATPLRAGIQRTPLPGGAIDLSVYLAMPPPKPASPTGTKPASPIGTKPASASSSTTSAPVSSPPKPPSSK